MSGKHLSVLVSGSFVCCFSRKYQCSCGGIQFLHISIASSFASLYCEVLDEVLLVSSYASIDLPGGVGVSVLLAPASYALCCMDFLPSISSHVSFQSFLISLATLSSQILFFPSSMCCFLSYMMVSLNLFFGSSISSRTITMLYL